MARWVPLGLALYEGNSYILPRPGIPLPEGQFWPLRFLPIEEAKGFLSLVIRSL